MGRGCDNRGMQNHTNSGSGAHRTPSHTIGHASDGASVDLSQQPTAHTRPPNALLARIRQAIASAGGWLPFDAFMQMALYEPGLGYYSHSRPKIGRMPANGSASGRQPGSDFVTAPEISPLFGQCIAAQIAQALSHTGVDTVYEFGAGNGTLARDILRQIGGQVARYCIVDVSGALRARQAETLAEFGDQVQWLSELPPAIHGVLLGNEVLDAMPVKLLARHANGCWSERGVSLDDSQTLSWQDRPTALRPPCDPWQDDEADSATAPPADAAGGDAAQALSYLTEIHPWADAFIRTTSERLRQGAALWIDYGFGEAEYYHPQRRTGTLVCHHQHRMDDQPLQHVGEKDITSHVDFTAVAVAAQHAGLEVLGYTTQAHFLINCGIQRLLEQATLPERIMAAKLLHEHEMGELFKVIMLGPSPFWEPLGFQNGDRTHTL